MLAARSLLIVCVASAILGSASSPDLVALQRQPALRVERLHARFIASPAQPVLAPATTYAGVVTTLSNFSGFVNSVTFDTDDAHLYVLASFDLERIETTGQTTVIATFFSTGSDTVVWDPFTHVFYVSAPAVFQILRVTPGGVVSTLAGGVHGTKDGQGTAAQFQSPTGMALDSASHLLYVADNDRLRSVSESGNVTTVGPASLSGSPHSVAFDSQDGDVGVTNPSTDAVFAFTPTSGQYRTLAGRCILLVQESTCSPYQLDGSGSRALFGSTAVIVYEAGSHAFYLTDGLNFDIRRIFPRGDVTTIAGNGTPQIVDGTGLGASFSNPSCAAVDPETNVIVVCDFNSIRFVTALGRVAPRPPHTFALRPAPTLISGPSGIVRTSDGSMWFAERTPGHIGRRFSSGSIHEYLLPPTHVSPFDPVIGNDGNVWFVDDSNLNQNGEPAQANIASIDSSGRVRAAAFPDHCSGFFFSIPSLLTFDPAGDSWFADSCPDAIGYMTPHRKITQYVSPQLGGIAIGLGPYVWAGSGSGLNMYSLTGTLLSTYNLDADAGVAIGPDAHVWFLSNSSQLVGNLDPGTGEAVTYQLPSCNCNRGLGNFTAGPDGALWFTQGGGSQFGTYRGAVGRMTTDGLYTEYPTLEARSQPSGIAFEADGTVWISDAGANKIGFMR